MCLSVFHVFKFFCRDSLNSSDDLICIWSEASFAFSYFAFDARARAHPHAVFSKHTHLYARQSVCIQCLVRMSHCVVSEVPNDLPMISPKKLVLKKLCRKKLSLKNIFKSPTSCRHPCTRLPSGCSPAILNFFLIPIERCVRKRCGRDDEAVMMRGRGSCLRCV